MEYDETYLASKRIEPIELLSEKFDGDSREFDKKRILIFTQPRTASYTLCRYFSAVGWGLPSEYFSISTMEILWPRFVGLPLDHAKSRSDLKIYVTELERRRTRNSVFSIKLMWASMGRFQIGYNLNDPEMKKYTIYLRRNDFHEQVISFFLLQTTGVYSISAEHVTVKTNQPTLKTEDVIKRCAAYLIKEERSWFNFFKSRNIQPLILQTETLIKTPDLVFEQISLHFKIDHEAETIKQYSKFEKSGRYPIFYNEKVELKRKFFGMLSEFSHQRERQFEDFLDSVKS